MAKETYKELLPRINTLIFDVDGVYTDGSVSLTRMGEPFRTFNSKDTFITQLAVREGLRVIIITGGTSPSVKEIFEYLGVVEIHLGSSDKWMVFEKLMADGLDPATCSYMGDDIPDLRILQAVGLPCAPADAVREVLDTAHFISAKNGGQGAVRDLIEQILRVQGKWMTENTHTW